jgi:hypothetical protein
MSDDEAKELLKKRPGFKMGDTGIKEIDEAFKVGGEEGGYEVLFKKVGKHPGDLSALAGTSKDGRQEYVEEKEEEGFETWNNFIKIISFSAKDHSQVVDFDHIKGGMKDLSNSLLNSGEEGVEVDDLQKSSANEIIPQKINAFMKQANNIPFIYHPKDKVYLFHDVFVERAARKWEKERKELEAVEELKKREEEEKDRKWWKLWKS